MAKTTYWTGAEEDGAWATAGNWSNGIPASGDTVIFDGRGDSTGTLHAITTGPAAGGLGAALIHVRSNFTANGGASGSPLLLSATKIIFEGTGVWHIQCAAANQTTNSVVDNLIINSTNGSLYISSDVNTDSYYSKWSVIEKISGNLYIEDATVFSVLYDNGGYTSIGVDCVDESDSDAKPVIYGDAGTCVTNSPVGAGSQIANGYTLTLGTTTASPSVRPDVDGIIIKSSAIFNWQPVHSGQVPQLKNFVNYGGTLTAGGNNAKQIGSGAGELSYMYPTSIVDISGSNGAVAYGAGSSVVRYGGTYNPPSGAALTL